MTNDSFETSFLATTTSLFQPSELQHRTERLKRLFTPWKNVLIPLNNLLEWKHSYDPLIIFGFLTILFLLIRLFNPPVITLISCLTLFCVLIDLFGPKIFGINDQNEKQRFVDDQIYTRLCERIAHFEQYVEDRVRAIMKIRAEQPILSVILGSICLLFLAYFGQRFDNLLLSYLFLLIVCLVPGAIHQQIVYRLPGIINNLWQTTFTLIHNKIKSQ